eukprot:g7235.t1
MSAAVALPAVEGFEEAREVEALRGRAKALGDVHNACWAGDLEAVQLFLREDAEAVHRKDCFPEDPATFNESEWKAEYEEPPLGEYNRPLHYAAHNGHEAVARLLLEARGVDVDARNACGCTALFVAAQQGQPRVVRLLLDAGADPKLREDEHGLSPVDVADDEALAEFRVDRHGKPQPRPQPLADPPRLLESRPTSLRVEWSAPPPGAKGALPVAAYKLRLTPTGGADEGGAGAPAAVCLVQSKELAGAAEEGRELGHWVGGLAAGVEYQCSVAAVSIVGAAPFSSPSEPLATGAAAPNIRGHLSVASVEHDCVRLKWHQARAAAAGAFERYVL